MLQQKPTNILTRSSDWICLLAPFANSELGKAAFSIGAPISWNNLQQELKLEEAGELLQSTTNVTKLACISSEGGQSDCCAEPGHCQDLPVQMRPRQALHILHARHSG